MTEKKRLRYFTTRKWGYGSNIVNFLKFAIYSFTHNEILIIQDRNNIIDESFCLFSIVDLPKFVVRIKAKKTIPIENFKTLIKFCLYENASLVKKVTYSFYYLLKLKRDSFIKDFRCSDQMNSFFLQNYDQFIGKEFLNLWCYTNETKNIFKSLEKKYDLHEYFPDIAFQIRGGDKHAEMNILGRQNTTVSKFIEIFLEQKASFKGNVQNVFVMTDTYEFFSEIKGSIIKMFPDITVKTLAEPTSEGFVQTTFNAFDAETKKAAYYLFLFEIEMLRKAKVTIGSYNSNIFYLASLIRYNPNHKFISIDSTIENSYL